MRQHCRHICHSGDYECDPCWQLHTLVERMDDILRLSVEAANSAASRHLSIRSSMRMVESEIQTIRSQFALMVSMGDNYQATYTNQLGEIAPRLIV